MENKQGSGARAGSMGGKGFYIVLFLCAAVIGISLWIMLTDAGTNVEDVMAEEPVVDVSGAFVTMIPADEAMRTDPEQESAAPADTGDGTEDASAENGSEEDASRQEEAPAQAVFSETVTSYVWPVRGSVQVPYSIDRLLYDSTMADWRTHDGIDVACAQGEQVLAAAGGTVVDVSSDDLLGTTVEIDHGNGTHSIYANLAAEPPVGVGQVVTMGQVIGSVGTTALGEVNQVSHLHFAMTKDGLSTDPMGYLPEDGAE